MGSFGKPSTGPSFQLRNPAGTAGPPEQPRKQLGFRSVFAPEESKLKGWIFFSVTQQDKEEGKARQSLHASRASFYILLLLEWRGRSACKTQQTNTTLLYQALNQIEVM